MTTEKWGRSLLIINIIALSLIALSLGIAPESSVPFLYETPPVEDINLKNMLRANMGCIFASIFVWICGLRYSNLFVFALNYSMVYMACIAGSRMISFIEDGFEVAPILILYFATEVSVSIISYLLLKKLVKEGKIQSFMGQYV